MFLDLTQIRQPETHVARDYPTGAFTGDDGFRVIAPVTLAAELHKDDDRFRLVGRLTTRLELACSRCLEPFAVPVDAAFDLRYLPQALAGNRDEDRRSTTRRRRSTATTGSISARWCSEQCYLALPMKPLCRADCQGLCPMCGTNLNHERCECQPRWDDPRLAALKALVSPRTNDDA